MREPQFRNRKRKHQSRPTAWRDNGTIHGAKSVGSTGRRTCVQAQIKAILGCQKLPPTETAPFRVRPARSRRSGCSLLGLQACVWHWPSVLPRVMPPTQRRLPRPHLNGSPSTAPMPSCRTRGTSRQWNAWSGVFPIVTARSDGHGIFDPKVSQPGSSVHEL
jgi:hypothetical protein